ncbi:MAG: glycosyltransferase 87 family protein [Actinomycetota bacterium]|nr:glycosyltransferase 87 family protein [Actinomycetota bacterium]
MRAGRAVLVLCVCAVTLGAGWALKAGCLAPWDGRQYRTLCYNDIQPLYAGRGIDRGTFPYIHGELVSGDLTGGAIEYPVLTGTFMWASGSLADDADDYLKVSALLLAPFGLLTAGLLAGMTGWRGLLWGAAPALALYGFHNWDLLVVAAVVGAVWARGRGHPLWGAGLLGLGGALKLYPLLFVVPLALDEWRRSRTRGVRAALVAGATVVAANAPFFVQSPGGWWATYRFHSLRTADFNTVWAWGWPSAGAGVINVLTAVLIGASCLGLLFWGWSTTRGAPGFPWMQVGAASLASFLLWNKVHSPQFALWLLPFFALLGVRLRWWAAYSLVDLVLYVGIFRWFYDSAYLGLDFTPAKMALISAVWGRAALLATLIVVFMRAPATITPSSVVQLSDSSHPPRRVAGVGSESSAQV